MRQFIFSLAASCFLASASLSAGLLGSASQYNVFTASNGNFDSEFTDTWGSMAIGGNATMTGYTVASQNNDFSKEVLTVGGNLNFTNGTVRGGTTYGGTLNADSTADFKGTVTQGASIDFNAITNSLASASAWYAGLTPNGTFAPATDNSGNVFFGTDPSLNVFNLTVAELESAVTQTMGFYLPTTGRAVINVFANGDNVFNQTFRAGVFELTMPSNATANGNQIGIQASDLTDPDNILRRILFNFVDVDSADINGSWWGSMLAIDTDVTGSFAGWNGALAAESYDGNHEFHDFIDDDPDFNPIPEPSVIIGMISAGSLMLLSVRRFLQSRT